jgi:hypothetical protein
LTNLFEEEKLSSLPSEKKVGDENLPLWNSFFSSTTFFRRQHAEFFLSKKKQNRSE